MNFESFFHLDFFDSFPENEKKEKRQQKNRNKDLHGFVSFESRAT